MPLVTNVRFAWVNALSVITVGAITPMDADMFAAMPLIDIVFFHYSPLCCKFIHGLTLLLFQGNNRFVRNILQ